jgi:hypothetical protein
MAPLLEILREETATAPAKGQRLAPQITKPVDPENALHPSDNAPTHRLTVVLLTAQCWGMPEAIVQASYPGAIRLRKAAASACR